MGRSYSPSSVLPLPANIREDVRNRFDRDDDDVMNPDNVQVDDYMLIEEASEQNRIIFDYLEANDEMDPNREGPFWREELGDLVSIVTQNIMDIAETRARQEEEDSDDGEEEGDSDDDIDLDSDEDQDEDEEIPLNRN